MFLQAMENRFRRKMVSLKTMRHGRGEAEGIYNKVIILKYVKEYINPF
jgi:hypothetical protein